MEFTTTSTKEDLLCTTPFGPTKASNTVVKKENTVRNHSTIHNHNLGKTNEVETEDSIIKETYSKVTNKNKLIKFNVQETVKQDLFNVRPVEATEPANEYLNSFNIQNISLL